MNIKLTINPIRAIQFILKYVFEVNNTKKDHYKANKYTPLFQSFFDVGRPMAISFVDHFSSINNNPSSQKYGKQTL